MNCRLFFSFTYILILSALLVGCASDSVSQVDSAVKSWQSGGGTVALEQSCSKGATGACALLGREANAKQPLAVLQSVTSANQSRFVIVAPKNHSVVYYVRRPNGVERLNAERTVRDSSSFAADRVESFNLNPSESYELLVIGADGQLWDRRSFRSLDVEKKRPRLAVVSCMDDTLYDIQAKMWPQLMNQSPDAIFMIGDNIYADKRMKPGQIPDGDLIWKRYVDTRNSLAIFKSQKLIPVLATWDDHDFGLNDTDRTYAHKGESADIFFTFFDQKRPGPGFERGPGVASKWSAFGVQFALLDDRTFRSPNKLDLADQTHFGFEQEKWIDEQLKSTSKPVFLISGDQFFGGYHSFESFEGSHPKNFKAVLANWKKAKVPLVFVSGDRHLTEIIKVPASQLGYPTFEITSSGIHAKVFSGSLQREPSPQQLVGMDGVYNYSVIELMRADRASVQMAVQSFSLDQKLLYQKTLMVKQQ